MNGLWISILLGTILAAVLYLTLVLVTDWQKVAEAAIQRIDHNKAELLENNNT